WATVPGRNRLTLKPKVRSTSTQRASRAQRKALCFGDTRRASMLLGREGGAAAAATHGVGIDPFPAAFQQVGDGVIERDAFQEARALLIYQDRDPLHLVDMIALRRPLFQVQHIGQAGTASSLDADTQLQGRVTLLCN